MLVPNKIYPIKVEGYGFLYLINYKDSPAVHITTQFTENEKKNPNLEENYRDIINTVTKTNLHTTTKEKVIQKAKKEMDEKREKDRQKQVILEQYKDKGPPASKEEVSKQLRDLTTRWKQEDLERNKNWYAKIK